MRFWDASAIVPLILSEARSPVVEALYRSDPGIVAWWATRVECRSAVERRLHASEITAAEAARARADLARLFAAADEIDPVFVNRDEADRLLTAHPLRAADALQLAAALAWAAGREPACLDARLRAAAQAEGLIALPPVL